MKRATVDWRRVLALLTVVAAVVAILTLSRIPPAAAAAAPPAPPAKAEEKAPAATDPLGRMTPYGAVIGFLRAAERNDYEAAARFLEGKQPQKKKEDLARALKIVLNRGLKIGLEDLSRVPEGRLDDELNVYLEKVGTAAYDDSTLDIVLRRQTRPDAPAVWLFSHETLQGVPEAAERLHVGFGEAIWPDGFRELTFLSFPLFLLINQLLLIPLICLVAWVAMRILTASARPLLARWSAENGPTVLARLGWPLWLLLFGVLLRAAAQEGVTVAGRIFYASVSTVLIIGAVTWMLVRLTRLATRLRILGMHARGVPGNIATVELSGWLLMCAWWIAGLFLVLRSLGFEVTAAVAGLGVGGIAIAFAAQKTLENLFGTVTIVTDKPIHVGDTCNAGGTEGTVESIGLRSSRIRTADRVLVTIPNGQLASMTISNLSHRDKFLFKHLVRLRYDMRADQLREVLARTRTMLAAHAGVETSTARTRVVRFADFAIELEVFGYVRTSDHADFLGVQEELLLNVMDIVEASGAAIALPYQTPLEEKGTLDAGTKAPDVVALPRGERSAGERT
ncbi:MAG TPA: mechanosensitive ion channel family protein [Burkholderiales bacterium]|nr:mechanosensitive ion channel family protein [Burkholderiales bacterium]